MANGLVIKITNDNDYECVEIYQYGKILEKICFCGEWRKLDEDGKYYGMGESSFSDIFEWIKDAYTNDFSFISVIANRSCVSFWDSRPKGIFRRERKQVDIEYKFFLDSLHYKKKYDLFTVIELIRLAYENPEECALLLEAVYWEDIRI